MTGKLGGLLACGLVVALCAAGSSAAPRLDYAATALNVLPPGEAGGLNFGKHSLDQASLYDGLTPLFGSVKARDLRRYFKAETFGLGGAKPARTEDTGRRGLRILRDRWDVAHVYGKTKEDVAFGAGWVSAEDRGLLMQLIRGPGRVAALDGPAYDQSREFVPSAQTEAELAKQVELLRQTGPHGRAFLRQVDAFAAGVNAYYRSTGTPVAPWTPNDTIAAAALIGGRFGTGGGDEARRGEFLSELQQQLGAQRGRAVFDDLREQQDPEAPVSVPGRFPYGQNTGETGNASIDAGSVGAAVLRAAAAGERSRRSMSNALLVGRKRSATGHPLYVAGPQVGYFYPQFFLELDLHGGGIDARGAVFPGIPLVLIGRGKDFAWSATTSHSDIVDQYVETLCGDDTHYLYKGECREMGTFDAGTVKGAGSYELTFRTTVHGPVVGYARSDGKRVAISTKRSSRGRELLSAFAFEDLNSNVVNSARSFQRAMNQVEFGFNWTYVDDRDIAYFSSGRLPLRPPDVDLGLPTRGTGDWEWRGFAPFSAHVRGINPASGVIVNWNNKPGLGYASADDRWSYGPLQRVQLLSRGLAGRKKHTLASVVAAMNRAATQDFRGVMVLPSIEGVLGGSTAPNPRDAQMLKWLVAWRARGASRLDRNLDGKIDDAGAAIMDAFWPRAATAVLSPVLGPLTARFADRFLAIDDLANNQGSSYDHGWYSYVDKDLRTLLGRPVKGPLHEHYCGAGDLAACRASLWAALDAAGDELQSAQGADPSAWRADATGERIVFDPGLLPRTMRWTNRPTFQQAITFAGHRPRR